MCSNVTKFPIHETKKKRSKPVMTNTTTPSAATTSSSSKGFSFLHRDNSYSPNQTVGVGRSHRDFHGTTSSSAVSSTIPTFPVQQTTKTTLTSPPDKTVSEKRVSLLDLEREMKKRRRESGGRGGTVTSSSSSSSSSFSSKSVSNPATTTQELSTSADFFVLDTRGSPVLMSPEVKAKPKKVNLGFASRLTSSIVKRNEKIATTGNSAVGSHSLQNTTTKGSLSSVMSLFSGATSSSKSS